MASVAAPSNKIERAHQMYRESRYEEALGFYTEALSMAKTIPQMIALHSNRAACFLKLHHFNKAAEECTSVLELDQNHTGALMLRAQTLVTLKEYRSALFDVNRLMELNPSSEVYQNLEARLRTQLSLAPIPEAEAELEEDEILEEPQEPKLEQEQERESNGKDSDSEAGKTLNARAAQNSETETTTTISDVLSFKIPIKKVVIDKEKDQINPEKNKPASVAPQALPEKGFSENDPKGWKSIPKPKGHAALDYARWDRVEDDSSDDDDDDDDDEEDDQPQYRFRLKTAGVRPVK